LSCARDATNEYVNPGVYRPHNYLPAKLLSEGTCFPTSYEAALEKPKSTLASKIRCTGRTQNVRHFYECTDVMIFWHFSNQVTTIVQKLIKKTKNNRSNVQGHNLAKTYKLNHTFGYREIHSKKIHSYLNLIS
jgi:hypothetical protein